MHKPFFNAYTPKPVTPDLAKIPVNSKSAKQSLHDLAGASHDTVDQFEAAAMRASEKVNPIVIDLANQHTRQHSELQRLLVGIGGTPKENGTVSGKIQRRIQKLKQELSSQPDKKIIHEMKVAEKKLVEKYQEILRKKLDSETRATLERHLTEVVENQNRLKSLKAENLH